MPTNSLAPNSGTYIVIEGQDATGKDTQVALLAKYFKKQGKNVVTYSESGTASTDPFVAKIAQLNYGSKQNIDHKTRVLLYIVNRFEQWRKLAEPTLKTGGVVITSRNWLSTLIYEGYGANVSKNMIIKTHKAVMSKRYFTPDKIIIMTLSKEERAQRLLTQSNKTTSIDTCNGKEYKRGNEFWKQQPSAFQDKVNSAYYKIAKEFGIETFDASGTIEEVHQKLLKTLGF